MAKFKKYQTGIDQEIVLNITSLLPKNHLVYFIENCVSQLDTSELESGYSELGQSGFHPKMLLSVLFYGYIKGIRSGRKLAEACEENVGFIYLSKNYFPKKTVLNDFRCKHYKYFEIFFQEVLMLFDKSDINGSTSIFDGSKIKANASKKKTKTSAKYKKWLTVLSEDIKEIEEELSLELPEEETIALKKKITRCLNLHQKITEVESALSAEDEKVNLTDTDAHFQKGKKGYFDLFYNVQVGCNEIQVILHADVCTDANDRQQLQPCIEGVEKNTKQKVDQAIADAGYSSFDNMEFMKKNSITGFIPDQDFGKDFSDKPYHKHHFKEDQKNNQIICPKGQILKYSQTRKEGKNTFKVYKGTNCEKCPARLMCTKGKARTVRIEIREPLKQEMRQRLQTDEGKAIYQKRFHPIEAIFGHLKFNLGFNHFLLRGLKKVQAEFYLMCLTYNLRKLFSFFCYRTIAQLIMDISMKLYCYPSLSKNFLNVILILHLILIHIW